MRPLYCFACSTELLSIDDIGALGTDTDLSTGLTMPVLMCQRCVTESREDEAAFRKRMELYCGETEGEA